MKKESNSPPSWENPPPPPLNSQSSERKDLAWVKFKRDKAQIQLVMLADAINAIAETHPDMTVAAFSPMLPGLLKFARSAIPKTQEEKTGQMEATE